MNNRYIRTKNYVSFNTKELVFQFTFAAITVENVAECNKYVKTTLDMFNNIAKMCGLETTEKSMSSVRYCVPNTSGISVMRYGLRLRPGNPASEHTIFINYGELLKLVPESIDKINELSSFLAEDICI